MNFLKRALISIKRRVGKSLILMILLFVLGNIIAGAIAVRQAVNNTERSITNGINPVATINIDYEGISKEDNVDWEEINRELENNYLTPEILDRIGALSSVKYFDYSMTFSLSSKSYQRYYNQDVSISPMPREENEYWEYFSLYGVQYPEILDFKTGLADLVDGRVFVDEDIKNANQVILVSKNLAMTNDWVVGDTIALSSIIFDYTSSDSGFFQETIAWSNDIELDIVGIFEPRPRLNQDDDGLSFINVELENRIYTPNSLVRQITNEYNDAYKALYPEQDYNSGVEYFTPLFVLNSVDDLTNFREEAQSLLPKYHAINDSKAMIDIVVQPVKSIQKIADMVLVVAIIATLIILSLLIILFLRDRKYEMGIYLSLGEKKKKVVGQILVETIVVAMLAITLSLFSGNLMARSLSESMLVDQIDKQNSNPDYSYNPLEYMGYGPNISVDDLVDNYSVSLDMSTVILFYVVGLGTVLVSTIAPTMYIIRLNPKKIMM